MHKMNIHHTRTNAFTRCATACLTLLCPALLSAQTVLYLYGDVSAKGDIPSGNKPAFHPMRLNDTGGLGLSGFRDALQAVQLDIHEAYDQDTPLTPERLSTLDVLILASNQRLFTPEETTAVGEWIKQGGGLVAWSDSAFGGDFRNVGLDNTTGRDSDNLITEQFGLHFLTDNGAGNFLVQEYTEDHFINRNQKHGGIRFRGEGVSFVRVSPPARMLAEAQDGGLGGRLKVNAIDGTFQKETDAALAIAEVGKGRVVGLFDRNMLWNAGAGSRLSHSDNREFVQRMILWAAGIDDETRIPAASKKDVKTRNFPPTISIRRSLSKDNTTLDILAGISDPDQDGLEPEISWTQIEGPADAIFENNNPNTLTPRITLPAAGKYKFCATVLDGEFRFRRYIQILRN